VKIAHLTTVDLSLRYLVLPQLEESLKYGESIGISAPGEYVAELEARGIRHIPLAASTRGMSVRSDLKAAFQLWRALQREDLDVLHTHNPKPGLYGRIVGRLAGVPIVMNTVHGLYATEHSPWLKRVLVYGAEFVASRFSDAELVQSPEDFELMNRVGIAPRHRTHLLGNGVDLERFNPESVATHRDDVRAELGVGADQVLVGMVGRLVAEKGVPELIEVAARLGDGYVFVIAGPHDPDKEDAVPLELIRRGEEAGVRFLGMRRDVERLYGAFDIFVLPSHREGFPRAAMEAAASGLPVVATDIRGCRQVVDEGVNGHLFPVGDVSGLGEKITSIGSDPSLRDRMGRASAVKALEDFDERRVVDRVFEAYRLVARRKGYSWGFDTEVGDLIVEPAEPKDVVEVARLHQKMIGTGFLSSLGSRFLSVLYRALVEDQRSSLFVARDGDVVVGFIAGTSNTTEFYKRFMRRFFLPALWAILPTLFRPSRWRRIAESLMYGGEDSGVPAELLSMAVAPSARRRGLGATLVRRLLEWSQEMGVPEMKVIVGEENSAAVSLYQSCGFADPRRVVVHDGTASVELVWSG
jgi:glycosyltransferase involved in cell wall biosynthesis/ribosomal protein S18 acetylase RimI-like enzyme